MAMTRRGRHSCASCSRPLSRNHPGALCYTCSRQQRQSMRKLFGGTLRLKRKPPEPGGGRL